MSKKNPEEDSLEEALSPIVNRLIDKNYETSQDKIATQMAPLIGSAIREQIKSQKDDVVDALYPVLGSMISRYVTKTLEDTLSKINTQIQDGLSSESIKRKIKAKIQGVSESELLLNENATANIRALLLIHKETGIVLAHSENPNAPVSEPEMLASMMTAIRSFVNDWVEQNSDSQELGEIEYGGSKIIIEASGYSYLAVIVEGSAHKATYDKIRETLEIIVLKDGDAIREFDGDLDKFPNLEIYREISRLLNSDEKQDEKRKIHPLLFLIPLILLLWGGYSYYKNYLDQELTQKIVDKLQTTSKLAPYQFVVNVEDGVVTLKGAVPFSYHKQLTQTVVQEVKDVIEVKNELLVFNSLEDPLQISSNIAYLLKGLNTQKGINLTYVYDSSLLIIKGSVWNKQLKELVIQEVQSIKNIKNIQYELEITPPLLNTKIYFKKADSRLTPFAQTELVKSLDVLKSLDREYKVVLTSYSDQIGSVARNLHFSKKRVATVAKYLQEQGQISNEIVSVFHQTAPNGVDLINEPDKARVVTISYTKGKK
ncbi:MAG: BON domain-containing protein [Campylobacterota bacterium]|nr:BON domain-containing protein [Campylobacterota bacterium]